MAERTCAVSEIPEGKAKVFEIKDKRIAIFKVDGHLYAMDAVCSHKGGPLEEGDISGKIVTCPWHGAKFDIQSGKVVGLPAKQDLSVHRITIQGNDVFVELAETKQEGLKLELSEILDGDKPFSYKLFLDWLDQRLKFETKLYGVLKMKLLSQSSLEIDYDIGEIHITEVDLKELSRIMDEAKQKWNANITYCLYHSTQLPGHMLINIRGPHAPTSLAMDIQF